MSSSALVLALAALVARQDDAWRYVVVPEGDALRRPPPVAVAMSSDKPEELEVTAHFRGQWQRYGSLRFGDPDSTRVAVVLDHFTPTRADLYVDVGRDLAIGDEDRIAGDGPAWELSLAVATKDAEGRDLQVPRRVSLELGVSGTILGAATLGWLAGHVRLDGRDLRVLRRDGDANGFFGDAQDQLWIDRDGDGGFEPLSELFVVQPILALGGRRFALRTDRLGTDLRLELLEGAGKVRIVALASDGRPRDDVVDLQALLVGRDGGAVLARAPGEPTEVPVGEYRVGMVAVRFADPRQGDPWSYVFSEDGDGEPVWRKIEKDAEVRLDPLGALAFRLAIPARDSAVVPGATIQARPTLRNGDGLLINTGYRGREAPAFRHGALDAKVELVDVAGRVLASKSTGFA